MTITGSVIQSDGSPKTVGTLRAWPQVVPGQNRGSSISTTVASNGNYTLVLSPGYYELTLDGVPVRRLQIPVGNETNPMQLENLIIQ